MATATLTFDAPGPATLAITSVTRTDTGDVVTAVLSGSGASWTLTVTEPAPGLRYAYLLLGTWADGSTAPVSGAVNGEMAAACLLTSAPWTRRRAGQLNLSAFTDMDGMGSEREDVLQYAYDVVQDGIFNGLQSIYAIPLAFKVTNLNPGGVVTPQVRAVADDLTLVRVYEARGWSDSDKVGNKMSGLEERANKQIARWMHPRFLLPCALRGGVGFGVSGVDPRQARRVASPYNRGPGWCW